MVRGTDPVPSPASLKRMSGKLDQLLEQGGDLNDKLKALEGSHDRLKDRVSEHDGAIEGIAEDMKSVARRMETGFEQANRATTNGWRAVDKKVDEALTQMTAIAERATAILEAAEAAKTEAADTRQSLENHSTDSIAKAAQGGAEGVVKATHSSALSQILNSKVAWVVAASTGFTAIVSAAKNLPDAFRVIGHFINFVMQSKGGVT